MAYNLLAYSSKEIDWTRLNDQVMNYNQSMEYVPIPSSELNAKNALGISIPIFKIGDKTWGELENVITLLIRDFKMKVMDLYTGGEISLQNMNDLYNALYG